MRKYEQYRTDTPEWIGEIPEHWRLPYLKQLFKDNKRKNSSLEEQNLLSLSYGRIIRKSISQNGGLLPASFESYQIVQPGYIILRLTDLQNDKRSLRVGYSNEKGIITSAYSGLIPGEGVYPKYYYYFLHYLDLIKHLYTLGGGVRQSSDYKELGKFKIPFPPLPEQRAIAAFLDRKTEQIQSLIQRKQKLIELLKEQKAALINRAVTRGLDPQAPLKNSGIDWLGDIPEQWEAVKLKFVVNLNVNPKESDHNSFKIALENIESWTGKYVPTTDAPFEGEGTPFNPGDVLFNKLRPYLAKAFLPEKPGMCVNEILVFSPKENISDAYLFRLLLSPDFITLVNSSTYGAKMPRASWSFIGNQTIPIPPIAEQNEIVKHIDQKTANVDKTIKRTLKEIKFVKEYQQSLIAHAVLGKVDVREAAPAVQD